MTSTFMDTDKWYISYKEKKKKQKREKKLSMSYYVGYWWKKKHTLKIYDLDVRFIGGTGGSDEH